MHGLKTDRRAAFAPWTEGSTRSARRGTCAGAALAALGALAAGEAAAQGASDAGEGPVRLAGIDAITVYATRNATPAFAYPGEVTVLERDVIEDFNPSRLSDVFDAIPGARFDGGPRRAGETPAVRGLSGAGVLVLFDGARQSFLSGHDGRFFIDPELVQAVEVVRGPTSALYGSGALGGVIALRTISAEDVLASGEQGQVRVGGGYQGVSDEWRWTGAGVWRSADERFDVVASLTRRESGTSNSGTAWRCRRTTRSPRRS